MSADDLQASLDGLRDELASAEHLDAATRAKLAEAMREIAAELEAGAAPEVTRGLSARIRDAVKHFEEEHPDLVAAVGRVADALGSTGI